MSHPIEWLPGLYRVCRLEADQPNPPWLPDEGSFVSITRSDRELSVVAPAACVPESIESHGPFAAFRVAGVLDFDLVGVLAELTGALAEAGIPVFVLSTYETDYAFVREEDRERADESLAR